MEINIFCDIPDGKSLFNASRRVRREAHVFI